jgi:16S rRNA (adenine1518-N6/adenine1519-N6)-dimethyltransferase
MVSPKKSLGQHFLTDHNIAQKIVGSLSEKSKNVLEVGPGTGILTQYLLREDLDQFKVIEIDHESVAHLKEKFPDLANRILQADFLKSDLSDLFDENFSVIGNYPYNISSQILFKILGVHEKIDEVVGMFQKEVADRIASPPGSKKYGILSVLVQAYYRVEYLFTVGEKVFFPPPKVKSAVIRMRRIEGNRLQCDKQLYFDLVKTAFNQRRKTLRNALKKFEFNRSEKVYSMLSLRAEQLTVEDFEFLCQNLA